MERRQLGRTDLRVSSVGLGCGTIGGIGSEAHLLGRGLDESEALAMMDRAWDMGINLFDTANSYAGGASERAIGRWLKTKGSGVRDQLVLATKVRTRVGDGPDDEGLGRSHVLAQVDHSLARLGVDHLDLYFTHGPDENTPLEETLGVFDELIRAGKVRWIGASNISVTQLEEALAVSIQAGVHRFECVQNEYNLLTPTEEQDMLPLCAREGLGHLAFSPTCGGLLSGKYRLGVPHPEGSRLACFPAPYQRHLEPETFAALDRLSAAAEQRGVSMVGLALAWILSSPAHPIPLIAPRNPGQFAAVDEALETCASLDAQAREALTRLFTRD